MNMKIFNHERNKPVDSVWILNCMGFLLVLLLSTVLVSCGGGSSSGSTDTTTTTGQFIDDPVQGMDYSCSSGTNGVTNASGEYTCNTGDDVTFSIGPVTLGTLSTQSSFITPYSLFPNDTEAAINLARLLQSIDSDSNPNNNVITLSSAQLSLLPTNTDFTDIDFVTNIEAALGVTLIDTMTAMNHLNDAIILNGGNVPDGGHLPIANAGVDLSVVVQNAIALDGSGSSDADGDNLTYSWSIASRPPGSDSFLFTGVDTSTPILTPDVVGDYVAQLIVNDGVVNSAADMVTITSTVSGNVSDAPPSLAWVKEVRVESSGGLEGGIAFDSDNNLYLAAESLINFNGDLNVGYQDILVIKYGAAGDMLWSDQTGTASTDMVDDIAFDKSANVLYVTGSTTLSLHDQDVIGDRDIYIISYDAEGNRLWTIMDGTAQEERPYGMALDSSGNIFIAGVTHGNFDGNTVAPTGRDIFVAKYNSSGTKIWTRQLQGDNWERAGGIAVDSSDNIYITGYTGSDKLGGEVTNGSINSFVIKYSNGGVRLWTRIISSANSEYGHGVATDSNDNVFVTGMTTGDFEGNINQGGYDQFTAKYNTNGALIWITLTGGAQTDVGRDIVVDSFDRIYIAGSIGKLESGDIFDSGLTMFDTDGVEVWNVQSSPEYGTIRTDQAYYLALDSAENIYINGTTYGSFLSIDEAASNKVFVAKYNKSVAGGPYSVGGYVTDAIGSFTLTNNGGDDLFILEDGDYKFDTLLNDGAAYNVEVLEGSDTSQGHACEVLTGGSNGDGSGTISGADVTDIQVRCAGI